MTKLPEMGYTPRRYDSWILSGVQLFGQPGFKYKMYGMYQPLFMKKKEIQIRHVFTPQISLNGSPSFGQFWEYYRDADGNDQYYSPYSSQQFLVRLHA